MNRTVTAAFDSPSEIDPLIDDLTKNGVDRSRIDVRGTEAGEERQGIMSGVRSWFSSIGLTRDDSEVFSEVVRRGGAVVSVQDATDEREVDQISRIMMRHGAVDIDERAQQYSRQGFTSFDESAPMFGRDESIAERERYSPRGDFTIPVVEENVEIGKRDVSRGGIRVITRVEERPVERDLNLRDETVEVERRAVDRPLRSDDAAPFQEGVLEMSETDEEPMVKRDAHVVEEVHVHKDVDERTEHVRETARRTEVDVERMDENRRGTPRS